QKALYKCNLLLFLGGLFLAYLCDSFRFVPFESYDSRSSLDDRDLFRSGFDYSEYGPNRNDSYGGRFDRYDNPYRNRRDQFRNRARDGSGRHRGQNWSRDWLPNNRSFRNDPYSSSSSSERLSARWNELSMGFGGRGFNPASRNLPSLFSQALTSGFGLYGFQGKQYGGLRMRRREGRGRGVGREMGLGRKRKQSTGSNDEPDGKMSKTDQSDDSDSEGNAYTDALFFCFFRTDYAFCYSRIMYVCSVCKFRTFEDEEIFPHLESKFHKENFKFIATKLPKETVDFLHEYIVNKIKKTLKFRESMEDKMPPPPPPPLPICGAGVGLDNFMKKVEAVHCTACEMFIPMQTNAIQRHIKTPDHNRNRKFMLEQTRKTCLQVAKSILNNRNIVKMLERYLKVTKRSFDPEFELTPTRIAGDTQISASILARDQCPGTSFRREGCYYECNLLLLSVCNSPLLILVRRDGNVAMKLCDIR
uniref:C2H2 AKAP95-type domain-containing protein n=1 Tax=Callorhinchus milii TaxID=7868 RepID=A0A4W3I8S8_CALMI